MKITIVKPNASILATLLKNKYPQIERIDVYPDGKTGIRAIQSEEPDIAIVDMDVTGLMPLKELNNTRQSAPALYVLLSEWQTFAYEAKVFGASVFLAKPFSLEALQKEIERMFAKVKKGKRSKISG